MINISVKQEEREAIKQLLEENGIETGGEVKTETKSKLSPEMIAWKDQFLRVLNKSITAAEGYEKETGGSYSNLLSCLHTCKSICETATSSYWLAKAFVIFDVTVGQQRNLEDHIMVDSSDPLVIMLKTTFCTRLLEEVEGIKI